jgi:5-methylcytosine-specific restriction endonuclease McrA
MKNSTYLCKTCGAESKISHQKMNIYCSNKCSAEGKLLESIGRAKEGLVRERPTLRKILAKLNGYYCVVCNISEYNGHPITLQVDHTNGDAGNNSLSNLRLICPNCHSQSDTFSGRNKGSGRAARGLPLR